MKHLFEKARAERAARNLEAQKSDENKPKAVTPDTVDDNETETVTPEPKAKAKKQ